MCALVPAAASGPPPSSSSVAFRARDPRSRARSAPSHHVIASCRCLSRPSYFPPARDTPLPAACRLLPLPAPPILLRPPLPTGGLSRSPPVPHRPINGKRPANNEQVNPHFVCVSDAHARSRKGSVSAPPPRTTRVSVRPQRITRASPCRPPSPSPLHPTASRRRPP